MRTLLTVMAIAPALLATPALAQVNHEHPVASITIGPPSPITSGGGIGRAIALCDQHIVQDLTLVSCPGSKLCNGHYTWPECYAINDAYRPTAKRLQEQEAAEKAAQDETDHAFVQSIAKALKCTPATCAGTSPPPHSGDVGPPVGTTSGNIPLFSFPGTVTETVIQPDELSRELANSAEYWRRAGQPEHAQVITNSTSTVPPVTSDHCFTVPCTGTVSPPGISIPVTNAPCTQATCGDSITIGTRDFMVNDGSHPHGDKRNATDLRRAYDYCQTVLLRRGNDLCDGNLGCWAIPSQSGDVEFTADKDCYEIEHLWLSSEWKKQDDARDNKAKQDEIERARAFVAAVMRQKP